MWVCEQCATRQGLEWGTHAACNFDRSACRACDTEVERGTRREWHPAAHRLKPIVAAPPLMPPPIATVTSKPQGELF